MAVQNKTRFAILGILALQPSSGYSIKQVCDAGISHFWNENYGHLYPMLRQMTLSGDIKIIESTDAGRRKYIYQITGQGMSALQEWLSQPVDAPPARLELLLKLSFGMYGSETQILRLLHDTRSKHENRLDELLKKECALLGQDSYRENPGFLYWHSVLRYGIMDAQFRLAWFDESISRIENTNKTEDRP